MTGSPTIRTHYARRSSAKTTTTAECASPPPLNSPQPGSTSTSTSTSATRSGCWPTIVNVPIPRLLTPEPIRIIGYPVSTILAEKIITAMQRGTANTRWRDFVDMRTLLATNPPDPDELRSAITRVADHRNATIRPLSQILDGYPALAQTPWTAWRRNQRLESTTPGDFDQLLRPVVAYVDALLT